MTEISRERHPVGRGWIPTAELAYIDILSHNPHSARTYRVLHQRWIRAENPNATEWRSLPLLVQGGDGRAR